VTIEMSRMNQILEIDVPTSAWSPACVFNLDLSTALAPYGFYYAPDPAARRRAAWVATSPRTQVDRTVSNTGHLQPCTRMEVVLPDGEVVGSWQKSGCSVSTLPDSSWEARAPRIVTTVILRIMRKPKPSRDLGRL